MFWELHWPVKTLHMRPLGPDTVQCNHYILFITTPFGSWYCCFVVLSSLCIVVLMYCCIVEIFYCCFAMLSSSCIVVLIYCHIVVMLYCCLVVLSSLLLLCWCIVVLLCWCVSSSMLIFLCIIKEHSKQQLLQYRSNFFVRHRECSKQQLLMKIQKWEILTNKGIL